MRPHAVRALEHLPAHLQQNKSSAHRVPGRTDSLQHLTSHAKTQTHGTAVQKAQQTLSLCDDNTTRFSNERIDFVQEQLTQLFAKIPALSKMYSPLRTPKRTLQRWNLIPIACSMLQCSDGVGFRDLRGFTCNTQTPWERCYVWHTAATGLADLITETGSRHCCHVIACGSGLLNHGDVAKRPTCSLCPA